MLPYNFTTVTCKEVRCNSIPNMSVHFFISSHASVEISKGNHWKVLKYVVNNEKKTKTFCIIYIQYFTCTVFNLYLYV